MNPILRVTLDLVFPSTCHVCRGDLPAVSSMVCHSCASQIRPEPRFEYRPTPDLDLLMTAAVFRGGLRELIHRFKYEGKDYLSAWLMEFVCRVFKNDFPPVSLAVPIPMSRWRLFSRFVNHAALLASTWGRAAGCEVRTDILGRRSLMPSQTTLNRRNRWTNARQAFFMRRTHVRLDEMSVLLVDDVVTTRATMDCCARLIRRSGAKWVGALAIARDELN